MKFRRSASNVLGMLRPFLSTILTALVNIYYNDFKIQRKGLKRVKYLILVMTIDLFYSLEILCSQ